jgi:hypothetical protein
MTGQVAFRALSAKIRGAFPQPIAVAPSPGDGSKPGDCMAKRPNLAPHATLRIGRPAAQRLPEYTDQPIPGSNSSSTHRRSDAT